MSCLFWMSRPRCFIAWVCLVPEELQGRVPVEIYQDAALKERPVRKAAAGTSVAGGPAGNAAVPGELEDEETVLERLRELGYIE